MKGKITLFFYSLTLALNYYLARFLGRNLSRVNSSSNYQPLPWIGINNSRRTQGTIERWDKMDQYLISNSSVLDIGCDVGYFVFKSAEKGCLAWGVDDNIFSNLIANYAKNKIKLSNSQFFLQRIDDKNVNLLPRFDYIIFLSVFHHWCKEYGFDGASKMLSDLIKKTNKGLFFEMGQSEMGDKYNIPKIQGDFENWLKKFLEDVSGKNVKCLGKFHAFVDKGKKEAERSLFLIY